MEPVSDDGRDFNADLCQVFCDGQALICDIKRTVPNVRTPFKFVIVSIMFATMTTIKLSIFRTYPNHALRLRSRFIFHAFIMPVMTSKMLRIKSKSRYFTSRKDRFLRSVSSQNSSTRVFPPFCLHLLRGKIKTPSQVLTDENSIYFSSFLSRVLF